MIKNIKYLLSSALLAGALSASAVPAYPGLIERTLEDGTKVQVQLRGDEYFNYMTDTNGYLLRDNGGRLSYKLQDGKRVLATNELINEMRVQAEAMPDVQMLRAGDMQKVAKLTPEGRTTFNTIGDQHFLVLLVQYDDIKFSSPTIREDVDNMLNGSDYHVNNSTGSAKEYFKACSNGKFNPTFDVSEVVTLSHTSAYYTGGSKYSNIYEMVIEAVTLADEYVDYSKYCVNTPGVCDAVIIWYAGYGQADTGNTDYIWPHQSSILSKGVVLDGTKIGPYCCFNELNGTAPANTTMMAGIGTPVHEFGHVMGAPDLYDPLYVVRSTPTNWSIMDAGPYAGNGYCPPTHSAYERWLFNWLEYEDIEEGTEYTLEDLNKTGRALRIPVLNTSGDVYEKEYFLLESRYKDGYDCELPNSGMLIWHIDYNASVWNSNKVNSTEGRKRCHLVTADGSANYNLNTTNAASSNAAWPYKKNYLSPDTDITLDTYYMFARSTTGESYITDIKADKANGIVTFGYNMVTETTDAATVLDTPTRGQDIRGVANNDITFTWAPVEGATGYELSVWRKSGSKVYYESPLENYNVGNVTSYTIAGMSRTKMDLEYHATVRVMKGVPSSEISNEVVFVPSSLEVSGVESVDADIVNVVGMKGYIQAPADAQIFDMSGARVRATELQPGIYVVRCGQKAVKVRVQ